MKPNSIIIIADDDDGHATLVKMNLLRAGIKNEIMHFENGQKAYSFIEQLHEKPDPGENQESFMFLLDIKMPVLDGVELLKLIKSDIRFKHMPVIMFTTTDSPDEIEKCYEFGCNIYIVKPIDYDKFTETIYNLGLLLKNIEVPVNHEA